MKKPTIKEFTKEGHMTYSWILYHLHYMYPDFGSRGINGLMVWRRSENMFTIDGVKGHRGLRKTALYIWTHPNGEYVQKTLAFSKPQKAKKFGITLLKVDGTPGMWFKKRKGFTNKPSASSWKTPLGPFNTLVKLRKSYPSLADSIVVQPL